MTILKINNFTGMTPRLPADRLPDGAAQHAENCNFAHGELRSLKGPASTISTTGEVRSLFTDNGARFYAWPTDTRAYLAPTIDDTFDRVYYNTDGQGLRVAQMSAAYSAVSNPRPPAQSWKVGVTQPTVTLGLTRGGMDQWGDTPATPKIYAVRKLAGAEVARQEATIVTLQSTWEAYTVSIGDFLDGTSAGAPAGVPVAPVEGWIEGPDSIVLYLPNTIYDSGDESNVLYPKGANFFGPGLWRVNASGDIVVRASAGHSFPTFIFGWGSGPSGAQYKGHLYSIMADLFAAIQDGSAGDPAPSTDATQALTDTDLSFVLHVVDADDNPIYTTDVTRYVEAGGNYVVYIEYPVQDRTNVVFTTTFENTWGEESAPSPPAAVELLPYHTVRIEQTYAPEADEQTIAGFNIYRTYPGSNTEFIKANPALVTTKEGENWVTTLPPGGRPPTATALLSTEWDPPPADLHSLTYAGNGFFAGASGKDLRCSEPYRPHAWPYFMTFPNTIVGIIEVEGGLLVTTTAQPYLVYGAHPEQMSMQALNAEQAGVTNKAMTRVRGSAIYASNDGLVSVSSGQASLESSQQLFTRDDWRTRYGSVFQTLHLGAWDGYVIGVSGADNFILRMDEAPGFSLFDITGQTVLGSAVVATTDEVYLLYSNGFAQFGQGSYLPMTWQGRINEYPRPVFFGAGIAKYSGTISVVLTDADSGASHTVALPADKTDHHFRLPTMSPSKRWEATISGTGIVQYVEFGASFAELQNG